MSKKNNEKKASNLPYLIIGLVFVAIVIGVLALYNTSKPDRLTSQSNSAANSRTSGVNPANAPPGASLGPNVLGPVTAVVTIEEFADLQCPVCARTHPTMKELQGIYSGNKNVRFIYRQFPLPGHDKSFEAALAVESAGLQGSPKFWQMIDQLMTNQTTWSNDPNYKELWKQYAGKIGLDVEKWAADANSMAARERVDDDLKRGRGLGISSTPSILINGKLIPFQDYNTASLKRMIDSEIAAATQPANANQNAATGSTSANGNTSN
ncbi:MAG TPA: thioredoxin domain-containing protein [Pyrinomonadaceae bacterium]|nr:thioredoxin domain-containing protein [Pyrinomonadaceae bacterium]